MSVIVVDLSDLESLDAATRDALFAGARRRDATLVVVAKGDGLAHAVIRLRDGTGATIVVDSMCEAAVRASQVLLRRCSRDGFPLAFPRRHRVVRSI